jgi:hypothetical protein
MEMLKIATSPYKPYSLIRLFAVFAEPEDFKLPKHLVASCKEASRCEKRRSGNIRSKKYVRFGDPPPDFQID